MRTISYHCTFFLILCTALAASDFYEASIELHVVDDQGSPVLGADARVTFLHPPESGGWKPKYITNSGKTNAQGIYSTKGQSLGKILTKASKEGYYLAAYDLRLTKSKNGFWLPNPKIVQLEMTSIDNPVPMYCKNTTITIPKSSDRAQYDFSAGDFLPPLGEGTVGDLIISVQKRDYKSYKDYEAKLIVSVKDGGMIENISKDLPTPYGMPKRAPSTGYLDSLEVYRTRAGGEIKDSSSQKRKIIFKTRKKKRPNGEIVFCYGYLFSEIEVVISETEEIQLKLAYVFNPEHDNNLEFEEKANLFNQ